MMDNSRRHSLVVAALLTALVAAAPAQSQSVAAPPPPRTDPARPSAARPVPQASRLPVGEEAIPPAPPSQPPQVAPFPDSIPAPALIAPERPPLPSLQPDPAPVAAMRAMNEEGPPPSYATARCKDGSYLAVSEPSEAQCAEKGGLAVIFPTKKAPLVKQ